MKKESNADKVIIDTNIWISFLIGKHLKGLHRIIASNAIKIITCKEQLAELAEVFQKPKISKYFTTDEVNEFFKLLDDCSLIGEIESEVTICRDPKDNYLLALAKDAGANYIISSDNDLLTLESFALAKIIPYSDVKKYFAKT